METASPQPHATETLPAIPDAITAPSLGSHIEHLDGSLQTSTAGEVPTSILPIPYHPVGKECERFASHLLSRGTTFQRVPTGAAELRIEGRLQLNIRDDQWFALSGPAVLAGGRVCQGVSNGVVCWNPQTGERDWAVTTDASVDALAVCDGLVVAGSRDGKLRAWSAERGLYLWQALAEDWVSGIARLNTDSVVYGSRDGFVRCVSLADGSILWKRQLGARIFAQPCVDGDRVFVGARNGLFFALDSATGEILGALETGSDVHGAAAVSGDCILFGSDDKRLYCLDRDTLGIRWMFRTGDAVWCRPVVVNESVIFGSTDTYVYSVDLATGRAHWEVGTQAPLRLGLAVAGTTVCVANERGRVMLLDVSTGEALGAAALADGVWAAPASAGSSFILATKANELVSIPRL